MQHLVCAIFIFQTRSRACLKNDFHKLGLAAHEKLFLDTLRIAIHGRRSYENRREGKERFKERKCYG